ncbi:hypothetical protein LSH36_236g03011 [Paralvinella palmiformis]|uniref:Major facilitator superfamily (MFS) profile domain-containing protein n=1 Tax=Paralvinella palmiformis TaxID=53620 RepID=A0AAD9N4X7_9ANNE|nr:hypothetical protein LSH36_236g03011 [Paralvinella palmiformis]
MIGGLLFGTLSDMFGRKPFVLLTLYAQIGIGVWIAFASNYILFVLLRFGQGILMQGLQTTSIVLIMELFQHKYSAIVGSVFEVFWGIGVMWLALIAYLLKNWQHIQLTVALSSIVTVFYIWLIPESMRWLVLHRKHGKAEKVLAKAARFNKVVLPSDPLKLRTLPNGTDKTGCNEFLLEDVDERSTERKTSHLCSGCNLLDMFRLNELRRCSLIQFYIWFVVTASYYGLSLRLSSFAGDRYLNFFYGGLCELPAYCVAWIILTRFGRRGPLIFYLVVGGITGVTAGVTSRVFEMAPSLAYLAWIPTTMAVLSRVSMAGCFSILWLYSSELYPTVIRNMGIGACTFWMRVGAMVSPQILLLGDVTYPFLPVILFGILCLVAGGLTLLLPETINTKLPETFGDIKQTTRKNTRPISGDDGAKKIYTSR